MNNKISYQVEKMSDDVKIITVSSNSSNECKTNISKIFVKRTKIARKFGAYINFHISYADKSKNNFIHNLITRGLENFDDRMSEYRSQLNSVMFILQDSGLFKKRQNQDLQFNENIDFSKSKFIRYHSKAFCSCGCSPSFKLKDELFYSFDTSDLCYELAISHYRTGLFKSHAIDIDVQLVENPNNTLNIVQRPIGSLVSEANPDGVSTDIKIDGDTNQVV